MSYQIVILISGNGSNLQAIIDAIAVKKLSASIACVISNQKNAYGLTRAKHAHIPTEVLEKKSYTNREDYDQALLKTCQYYQPDLIVLAGFMYILDRSFVDYYAGKIINIHPSLLPNYPGLNTYQQALDHQACYHGVSIHFVTAELDGGPLIIQIKFNIHADDTVESLKLRTQAIEHQLYPLVIHWLSTSRIHIDSTSVIFDQKILPTQPCFDETEFEQVKHL